MIEILILIYSAILWVVFKVFKVPINKWTATTAILVGFFAISLIILIMNFYHPYSRDARLYFYTTPIYSRVDGRVVEVPVERNTPLNKGDVLFRFDPRPFELKVEGLRGTLEGAVAERDRSKEEYDRSLELLAKGAGAEREVQRWRIRYETAAADIEATEAKLNRALYDLREEVVVRAPTDGYVTQVRLRPGMSVVASPQFIAALTFVHAEEKELVAAFPQNGIQNIKAGHDAEVTFDAIPGRAFKAQVKQVYPAIAQGQLTPNPSGLLINFDTIVKSGQQGRVPVKITVLDDLSEYQLPAGAKAEVAVYSKQWQVVAIIRKVLLRVKSWEKYIFIGG